MNPFFSTYRIPTILATLRTGLFPSVMLAQAALESNYGNSILSKNYNNFFGIKADSSWTGDTVNLNTIENTNGANASVNSLFRSYPTPKASFKDRVLFFVNNPRYANIFNAATPENQAQAIQDAGYATDPNYASKIISIINDNSLKDIDNQAKLFSIAYYVILFVAIGAIGTSIFFMYKYVKKK